VQPDGPLFTVAVGLKEMPSSRISPKKFPRPSCATAAPSCLRIETDPSRMRCKPASSRTAAFSTIREVFGPTRTIFPERARSSIASRWIPRNRSEWESTSTYSSSDAAPAIHKSYHSGAGRGTAIARSRLHDIFADSFFHSMRSAIEPDPRAGCDGHAGPHGSPG
jgi:hypothetical protein